MKNNPIWEFGNTGAIIKLRYPSKKYGDLEVTIDTEDDAIFVENETSFGLGETWIPIELMKHIVSHYDEAKTTGQVE